MPIIGHLHTNFSTSSPSGKKSPFSLKQRGFNTLLLLEGFVAELPELVLQMMCKSHAVRHGDGSAESSLMVERGANPS
jgi:hypothetical protein